MGLKGTVLSRQCLLQAFVIVMNAVEPRVTESSDRAVVREAMSIGARIHTPAIMP